MSLLQQKNYYDLSFVLGRPRHAVCVRICRKNDLFVRILGVVSFVICGWKGGACILVQGRLPCPLADGREERYG